MIATETKTNAISESEHPSRKVFVSYERQYKDLADELRDIIKRSLPCIEVFLSSQPDSIHYGDDWLNQITASLNQASVMLVLIGERTLKRFWVPFETGFSWHVVAARNVKILPVLLGTVRESDLPVGR